MICSASLLQGSISQTKKIHLNFESRTEEDEGLLIPKVWFYIYRVPEKLRELPVVWALGSMIGAPQLVDMTTTK